MASDRGVYLFQLRRAVREAKSFVKYAESLVVSAKSSLRDRERELRKWTAPDRRRRQDRRLKDRHIKKAA